MMPPKCSILLKVLVSHFHPGAGESFFKGMPKEMIKDVLRQNVVLDDPAIALTWPEDVIAHTHYSWLAPLIQQVPQPLQASMVAALPEPQSSRLKSYLKIATAPTSLAESVKRFLIYRLCHQWQLHAILPRQYLPPSELIPLLELSKGELVELIDFLAMHDLAESIRHIVDKKNLKSIYLCLTPKKQQYLRLCLHQKEKIATPKLEIDKWDGDVDKLNLMLHRRGMFRLGKALCGQHPHFMWHITHILDTGRGSALSKHYQEKEIAGVTPFLVQQVLALLNFLKKKGDV